MRGTELLKDWKFYLGEIEGAHLNKTDDSNWRSLSLPHDWSVEFSFDKEKGEACTGFLLGGIGWYRKHFITEQSMSDGKVFINFDGIYNRSTIYCNGQLAAFHPYGYSPLVVDLTEYLNPMGQDNVIAVKVDHSRYADSRWYTGSGIYRKVSLNVFRKAYIPVWGTFFKTSMSNENEATIDGSISIANETDNEQPMTLKCSLYDPEGNFVCEENHQVTLSENSSGEISCQLKVKNPILWDIHDGQLYTMHTKLIVDGETIQQEKTNIGIRTFLFDADKGFYINGRNELIKGVCLHHDGGLVGAAVPKDVWRRRLEMLKSCGCNAIRTAHNPSSEDFLDLCDEMGFLVQEEFFDEWDNPKDKRKNGEEKFVDYISRGHAEYFREYAKDDLQNVMKRDRNHPSIIQWSIGNEIEWTYTKYNDATGYFGIDADGYYFWSLPPYSREEIAKRVAEVPKDYYDIHTTAKKLADWTREMDVSRPVTANCILPTVSYETGYIDQLDLVGYSYRRVIYDYGHKHFPDKPIMGTENVPQWHEWKAVLEHDHISGIFLWTGIDHMGEAWVQKPWPRKGSNLGLLDLAGFPKQSYHMFRSLWCEEPYIHLATQTLEQSLYKQDSNGLPIEKEQDGWKQRLWFWHEMNNHWNYKKDELVVVEAYSNCEEIALYLGDRLIGTSRLEEFDDHIYKWIVPYDCGEIIAIGVCEGTETEVSIITASEPSYIELSADKTNVEVNCDSVAHLVVQLYDNEGNPVLHEDRVVEFLVEGPCKVLGVDNGHPDNVQDFQSTKLETSEGRALMILQGSEPGEIKVKAMCGKDIRESKTISIQVN